MTSLSFFWMIATNRISVPGRLTTITCKVSTTVASGTGGARGCGVNNHPTEAGFIRIPFCSSSRQGRMVGWVNEAEPRSEGKERGEPRKREGGRGSMAMIMEGR